MKIKEKNQPNGSNEIIIHGNLAEDFQSYNERKAKKEAEFSKEIADLSLERFPRKLWYGVLLRSSEDDAYKQTLYCRLTDDELEILRECQKEATEEEIVLEDVLREKGYLDLCDELTTHDTPMELDTLESIDLEHPLKFADFYIRELLEDGKVAEKERRGVPLTDEEYKELLCEHLKTTNQISINMLVSKTPALAQKIMHHLCYGIEPIFDIRNPFVCEMDEFKKVTESILNPFKDVLGLFNSENENLKKFVHRHQIVPEGGEIFTTCDDQEEDDIFHCIMSFCGTKVELYQEGLKGMFLHQYYDVDSFKIEAARLMEKFGLTDLKEIFPYLKEHYGTRDCLARIKQLFQKD